ncbi:hypothetical protein HanXRQr2_Chr08g0322471 [Helianthus annuus]|uniref:Uncharacterized protein n=1 Tax=Helianthus annuus TaxID=4232 RepID=A0A9K3IC00_HELAN|nr:hypothetical protein HanXRQr2_Chr08g0322471 [Helianthus annuus]KAJ0900305.1 hypothetical protein HanPSC8_Chr08g0312361 [Helianthus annuus]
MISPLSSRGISISPFFTSVFCFGSSKNSWYNRFLITIDLYGYWIEPDFNTVATLSCQKSLVEGAVAEMWGSNVRWRMVVVCGGVWWWSGEPSKFV